MTDFIIFTEIVRWFKLLQCCFTGVILHMRVLCLLELVLSYSCYVQIHMISREQIYMKESGHGLFKLISRSVSVCLSVRS